MLMKTYTAPDLASALSRAREDLGAEALVLGTRETVGKFGLPWVEVTVGAPRTPTSDGDGVSGALLRRLAREVEERGSGGPAPRHPAIARAVDALVATGLDDDLATRFARAATRVLSDRDDDRTVRRATGEGIRAVLPCEPRRAEARRVFVVGPPGAGKTTTVAKLAARSAVESDDPVVFAEADAVRVGAAEQAWVYADAIGARLVPVRAAADLDVAVRGAGRRGRLYIDTPGVGAADRDRLDALRDLRKRSPDAEVLVLLPAGLHRDDARAVLDRFAPLEPTCVGFSRVDDARRVGELVTAAAPSGLPLTLMTTGHRVPDDLVDATPWRLASMLIGNGTPRARAEEVAR